MSKFYLPTQKGTQLFPTTVVAPPIVRWVGVDPRTADGQAILDTFGSAITAFHMQQAHNHSLSVNTQSRGFVQLAPNLGVQYVNQGGAEYITIHAQLAPPPVVKEDEAAPASVYTQCWYPPEVIGAGSLYDMLVRSSVLLVDPVPLELLYFEFQYENPELPIEYWPYIQGTIPLQFERPLKMYGVDVTEFGFVGGNGIWVGLATNEPITISYDPEVWFTPLLRVTPSARVIDLRSPILGNVSTSKLATTATTRTGATQFPGSSAVRRYLMIEVTETNRYDLPERGLANKYSAAIFIEESEREGRGKCPALVGLCAQTIDVQPWMLSEGLGMPTDFRSRSFTDTGQIVRTQTINPLGSVQNGFAWSYIDPSTQEFVALSADNPWITTVESVT